MKKNCLNYLKKLKKIVFSNTPFVCCSLKKWIKNVTKENLGDFLIWR